MTEHPRRFVTKHFVRKAGRLIKEVEPDRFRSTFMTAVLVLEMLLGNEWVAKRVFPRSPNFLSQGLSAKESDPSESMARTIELAEALLNLQVISGFHSALKRIRDAALEPEMAPLLVAKVLIMTGREFRFVEPVKQARQDFDLQIEYNGMAMACEVKSKLESTPINSKTILRTLRKSAKQLPAHMPAVVFFHIPQNWNESFLWDDLLESTTKDLFRQRTRINAVFAISNKRLLKGTQPVATAIVIKPYIHPSPRQLIPGLERLFTELTHTWTTFADLLNYAPAFQTTLLTPSVFG